jgi:hypothetical protein
LLQSFVCNSAAAGFFPGQLFFEEAYISARRRKQFAGQSARWAASDDRYRVRSAHAPEELMRIGYCSIANGLAGGRKHIAAAPSILQKRDIGQGFPPLFTF